MAAYRISALDVIAHDGGEDAPSTVVERIGDASRNTRRVSARGHWVWNGSRAPLPAQWRPDAHLPLRRLGIQCGGMATPAHQELRGPDDHEAPLRPLASASRAAAPPAPSSPVPTS